MNVYVVLTNYFNNGFFGVYSSFEKARTAVYHFVGNDDRIAAFEEIESGCYEIVTHNGNRYSIEIHWDVLDDDDDE